MEIPKDMMVTRKQIITVVASIGSLMLAVGGFYAFHFWAKPLSDNPADWAAVGTYFGGILNPLLAFLAFIGILYTVRTQAHMVEQNNHHQRLMGLQEIVRTSADRVEEILRSIPPTKDPYGDDAEPLSYFIFVSGQNAARGDLEETPGRKQAMKRRRTQIVYLRTDLIQLTGALLEYREAGGHKEVLHLYNNRYGPLLAHLTLMGFDMTSEPYLRFFNVDEMVDFLRQGLSSEDTKQESGE